MQYRCDSCGAEFEEPKTVSYCNEEYNGVSDLFPGSKTYSNYAVCPECGSQDFDDKELFCRHCTHYRPDERYKGVIGWCDKHDIATEVSGWCEDCEKGPQKWMNGEEVKE